MNRGHVPAYTSPQPHALIRRWKPAHAFSATLDEIPGGVRPSRGFGQRINGEVDESTSHHDHVEIAAPCLVKLESGAVRVRR